MAALEVEHYLSELADQQAAVVAVEPVAAETAAVTPATPLETPLTVAPAPAIACL
jgi:hypothetical protein